MNRKEQIVKTAISLFLTALIAISSLFLFSGWIHGYFNSMDTLRTYISSFGTWGPLILLLIQFLLTIFPVCSSFMGCVIGTLLFGPLIGFLTNYIGISCGSVAGYYLARSLGLPFVNKMISIEKHETYIEKINRSNNYPKFLFIAILLPMAPDNFLCYFSGLINMPVKKFITIIITAKPWCILFYSIFFEYFI